MTTSSVQRPLGGAVRRAVVLVALLLLAWTQPTVAKRLKIATVSPDGSSWMKLLRQAGADVDAATEGRVELRFFPGGVQGDDVSVLRRMRIGQLHGGLLLTTAFGSIYSDLQAYNLPMAFRNLNEVDAVREVMDPVLMAGLREYGFVAFGIAEVGMAYPMGTRLARTVGETRKLKVWTPQGDIPAARLLKAFGVTPIPLPISEVLLGLSSGLIDTVASPPVAALPLLWHTRLKFVLDLPLMYVYGLFVVSDRALRGIEPADREVLTRIVGAAIAQADRQNRAEHEAARQALEDQGLEFITLTAKEIAEWRGLAATARRDWVAEGILSRGVYNAIVNRLDEIRGGP